MAAIFAAANDLRTFPGIGRPLSDETPDHRELVIPFSDSGYVLLYRVLGDIVDIQAVKHMREAGY